MAPTLSFCGTTSQIHLTLSQGKTRQSGGISLAGRWVLRFFAIAPSASSTIRERGAGPVVPWSQLYPPLLSEPATCLPCWAATFARMGQHLTDHATRLC